MHACGHAPCPISANIQLPRILNHVPLGATIWQQLLNSGCTNHVWTSYIPGVWILWPQNNERCSSIQTHLQITPSTCTFTCLCQMSIYFTAVLVSTEIQNLNLGSDIQQTSTWTCRWYWQGKHPCAKGKAAFHEGIWMEWRYHNMHP
jgi:hypothetical protein